jgi:phosphatidylglycerophosphatase A
MGAATGREDDQRIVIDEVVGQWLALAPLLWLPGWRFGLDAAGLVPLVTGFVAFRVLDVWKPGPVGWAERRFSGGLGVMLDDLVAGALGALALGAGWWALGARP